MYTKAKQAILDRVQFDAKRHVYTLDGMLVTGVTSVIDSFLPFENIPAEVLESARIRGTLVHQATERFDKGKLTEGNIADLQAAKLDGYLTGWRQFLEETGAEVVEVEQRVYHTKHRYCGTLDRIMRIDGKLAVIDIKSGMLYPENEWQTAAYLEAANDGRTDEKIVDRYVVKLSQEPSKGRYYKLEPHRDRADFEAFRGALAVTNWRVKRGR